MSIETTIVTVPTTAGQQSSAASGRLSDPVQTVTVGWTPAVVSGPSAPIVTVPGPKLVFCDTETTSLRHDRRAWEIALIVRRPGEDDEELTWFVESGDLDLGNADIQSLKIGKFYERHPEHRESGRTWESEAEDAVLAEVEELTRDAILVGAVPNFDTEVLANRMRAHGICPSWHYHLVDVETFAAGALRLPPKWSFDAVLAAYGLTYDEADRHTALGDTRMVRDLYDAVMSGKAVTR